jgi:hypothetical protein
MTQPVSIVLFWFWTALPKWHNHVCRSPCPAALDEVCPWLKRSWAWLGERCKSSFGDYNGELQNHWFCGGICLPQIGACYGLTQFGSGARDKSEEKWLSFRSSTTWLPLQENTTIVISISHLSFTNTNEIEMCKRYFVTTTPCFSHYNFQRFCRVVQAHYMYLRKLPEFEIQCFSSYKVKNGKGEKWVLWRLMCFTLRLSE